MIARARPCPPVPPQNLHGKEGVDGSSPSEGFGKALQIAMWRCLRGEHADTFRHICGTRDAARRLAAPPDTLPQGRSGRIVRRNPCLDIITVA